MAAAAKQAREAAAAAAKQEREARAAAEKQEREAKAAAAEQKHLEKANAKQKPGNHGRIAIAVVCAIAVLVSLAYYIVLPTYMYGQALSLMEAGEYENAIAAFENMGGYKESAQKIELCWDGIRERQYREAIVLMESGKYTEAIAVFEELDGYKDSHAQISECQNALIYQDALTPLEDGQYQAAQKRFEQIPHYKDSHALIQTCHQAYLQTQKEEAITFMQKGRYDKALPLLKSVEADGLGGSAEITECELGYLDFRTEPYVTRGNPVGKGKKIHCSVEGDVIVHSMVRVDLDNDCVRYTLDCTIPECEFVSFFDPPDGDIFMYTDWNRQEQGRHTYVFDALKKNVKAAKEMTVRFGHQENFVFTRNPY